MFPTKEMVLLDGENLCGATLLQLTSTGSALIAELLRLSAVVPEAFRGSSAYDSVAFDFDYLKEPEDFENRVNSSEGLLDLDQEFLEAYGKFAQRAYALFESMVKYWRDVNGFVDRLKSGYFIQHTVENVLDDVDGKQLLSEAYFLFGAMLTLLDARLEGSVRERLVVARYRDSSSDSSSSLENVDDVCRLIRRGSLQQLFSRVTRDKETVRHVIARLSSDDVYLTSAAFPDPSTRSIRLSAQASMIYVVLYFDPETLQENHSLMRQIVDRLFSDNWVVPVYMGHLVDLTVVWSGYDAASAALRQNVDKAKFKAQNDRLIDESLAELRVYLTEGQLTEQHLLDNMKVLLDCCRKSNSCLRWRLLHCDRDDKVISLLLQISQLEYKLKQMFHGLLSSKSEKWHFCRSQVVDRMTELSDYFTGEKRLSRVSRDENLMRWFSTLAAEAAGLSEDDAATSTGRKIHNLISALEEVEQFEQVDSIQIKAFLGDTREFLLQMVRLTNVQATVLSVLETVSDLSYAWRVLRTYVGQLRDRVRAEPSTAVLLRACFLKLASILDVPLIRISQCDSPDQTSVAQYYSSELVSFVREVLDVIPQSVFKVLAEIIEIQTNHLKPLPVKFETQYLKDFAQLDERYQLARLTNQVSVFTEGVLAMEQTLLGVVRVEPRRILHDGLRKELVRQLCLAMHEELKTPPTLPLVSLGAKIEGFRRSVEYVQDYIDIAGLKMWQEELSRIINYAVEQEANRYLRRKVLDQDSKFQSTVVPIPRAGGVIVDELNNTTFVGTTLVSLLRLTSPADTTYSPVASAWFDNTRKRQVCGIAMFQSIERALGVAGLVGLDKLLGFKIVHELAKLVREYRDHSKQLVSFLHRLRDTLHPTSSIPQADPTKFYSAAAKKLEKLSAELFVRARAVGHAQLLRSGFKHTLQLRSRLDANSLHQTLKAVDASLLGDACTTFQQESYDNNHEIPRDLADLLDASGFADPLEKIYLQNTDTLDCLPEALLVLVLSYASKLDYDTMLATLAKRKVHFPIDGYVLVVGVHSILKQFHPSYTKQLLQYLAQFLNSTVHQVSNSNLGVGGSGATASSSSFDQPLELVNIIWFVEQLCAVAKIPLPTEFVPAEILAASSTFA